MYNIILFFFYFCLILCLPSAPVLAITVTTKNGDTFTGVPTEGSGLGILQFETGYGVINIPWEDIAQMTDNEGNIIAPPAITGADGYLTPAQKSRRYIAILEQANVTTTEPQSAAAAPANPTAVEDESGLWGAKWSGRVNFGASLQSGNSDQNNINTDALVKAKWETIRAKIEGEYNREEDEGALTEHNRQLDGTLDYFYNEHWFVNNTLGFKQDEISDLDLRTTAGIGLGHQAYEQDDLNLQYILGGTYLHNEYENGDTEDSLAAKWSLDYDQKPWGGLMQVFHEHELLVPTDDIDAFIIESKTGVRVPLKAGLIGTAEVDYDWDNDPAPGAVEDDATYSFKLGYEW